MTRRKKIALTALSLLIVCIVYFTVGVVRSLYLESTLIRLSIPSNSGVTGTVRIAQVSDLHRAVFGENNQQLVDLVASKAPDLIVATGDMIDVRTPTIDATVDLFRRLCQIAPVVYSLGNHEVERDGGDLYALLDGLTEQGVMCVNNSVVTVHVNGLALTVGGVYTPALYPDLVSLKGPIDILLCHFPQEFPLLSSVGVPLMFSGHTHGGQFRIPLLDIATYAPGQGFFPKYTKGLYTEGESHMIVSRGLGNSSFPFRVHNPPEVIIADVTYTAHESGSY